MEIEIDAAPIATSPSPGTPPSIAVAPIDDAGGAITDPGDRELLDSAFIEAIAAGLHATGSAFRIAAAGDCDMPCQAASARRVGATYLVSPEIRRFAGAYVVTVSIVRATDYTAVRSLQSAAAATPADLLSVAKGVAVEVAAAIARLAGPAVVPPVAQGAVAPAAFGPAGYGPAGAPKGAAADIAMYRSRRDAGVLLFVLGILVQGGGGFLIGFGEASGGEEMFWSGIAIVAVGDVMFFGGLAGWVVNQVRIGKLERGLPLGRRLRLEGLAPVVASADGLEAPGLSARWSF